MTLSRALAAHPLRAMQATITVLREHAPAAVCEDLQRIARQWALVVDAHFGERASDVETRPTLRLPQDESTKGAA